jgi:hypothetical protein
MEVKWACSAWGRDMDMGWGVSCIDTRRTRKVRRACRCVRAGTDKDGYVLSLCYGWMGFSSSKSIPAAICQSRPSDQAKQKSSSPPARERGQMRSSRT